MVSEALDSARRGIAPASVLLMGLAYSSGASADVPCGGGEVDECRAYIEINATDGDIGFHSLFDAEGWQWAQIFDPGGKPLMRLQARGPLWHQTVTENFFESEEPPCWWEPDNEDVDWEQDEAVNVAQFFARFPWGFYKFRAKLPEGGLLEGRTFMTHHLPAAPDDIDFDGSRITWAPGDDLGRCEPSWGSGAANVPLAAYQVILEPDFDESDPADEAVTARIFSLIVPPEVTEVTVPPEHLASLPQDLPAKVEVIAIERRPNGSFGHQVAAEEGGFCINEVEGCEEEED